MRECSHSWPTRPRRRFWSTALKGRSWLRPAGEGALLPTNLRRAPPGKIYEAWVSADGKEMRPAGTFEARDDAAVVSLSLSVPKGGLVAVIVEDEPVDEPTGKPLFTAKTA